MRLSSWLCCTNYTKSLAKKKVTSASCCCSTPLATAGLPLWLESIHPDSEGFHLRIIAEAAKARILHTYRCPTGADHCLWCDVFEPIGMSFADVDFAMFWDVASLYQTDRVRGTDDRSDAEKALFKSALAKGGALNLWYGHYFTAVWIQSELPDGFEAKMSALGLARTYSESG